MFGSSSIVLAALKDLPNSVKEQLSIYVAECRGKTQYNSRNEIKYSDGLKYATDLRKAGFVDVVIVPDICVGNLVARGLIDKVVFGANGIDMNGGFGHTAGHLTIAVVAKHFGVPVYVISDLMKLGELEWEPELVREGE